MSLIDFVRGQVVERGADAVVLAVGGFGLRLLVSATTHRQIAEPGEETQLYAHLYLREEVMTLYGFASRAERTLFQQLLGVSGVGPKVALAALSATPVERLAAAVADGDVAALARIPGIGKKTAARIVLDLKGKLVSPTDEPGGAVPVAQAPAAGPLAIAAAALREFGGFTPAEVAAAIATLPQDAALSDEEAVRLAFRAVSGR